MARYGDWSLGVVSAAPLASRADLDLWIEVCTDAFEALQAGVDRPPLDPYGATNPAEFFAVATECFFEEPVEMERRHPRLYGVLRDFYGQDTAARYRRYQTEKGDARGGTP